MTRCIPSYGMGLLLTILMFVNIGCATKPNAVQTGFLKDYSRLTAESENRAAYRSQKLVDYDKFMVDPVEVLIPGEKLNAADRAEAARYFRATLIEVLQKQGLSLVNDPAPDTMRFRIALTDIAKSTWWQKIHPASRALGAGTGGAAMEAEVIDAVTGEQLAAVVQAGSGNQFDFTAFSTLADVKSAIDAWSKQAGKNLERLRSETR